MRSNTTPTSGLRILVCNDDGVQAKGLAILERIAKDLSPDVWVISPKINSSGRSSAVTFDDPVRIQELSPRRFAVRGTPVDCVICALRHVLADRAPDVILSGVNAGSNVGEASIFSATLGAAMAGALQGIKSIGVSLDAGKEASFKYAAVEHFLPGIIRKLLALSWPERTLMNVNFPNVPVGGISGIRAVPLAPCPLQWTVNERKAPDNTLYYWIGTHWAETQISSYPRTDLHALCQENAITVTPVQLYANHDEAIRILEEVFSSYVP
ncbi:MAG: 5'/3'-nucleotidase SurE [Holosporales bacterium]|jgi:5'-nucleotidase|nr:5'/3'-nucleotidase SurE [Holosporales bacterium]